MHKDVYIYSLMLHTIFMVWWDMLKDICVHVYVCIV
jgi:hypothetical protein